MRISLLGRSFRMLIIFIAFNILLPNPKSKMESAGRPLKHQWFCAELDCNPLSADRLSLGSVTATSSLRELREKDCAR